TCACAHRNRRGCRDEARRSLRCSSVYCLSCETTSGRRAHLLVRSPDRPPQCRLAAVDCMHRYKGRRAGSVSRPSTDRSRKGIGLALLTEQKRPSQESHLTAIPPSIVRNRLARYIDED